MGVDLLRAFVIVLAAVIVVVRFHVLTLLPCLRLLFVPLNLGASQTAIGIILNVLNRWNSLSLWLLSKTHQIDFARRLR